SCSVALDVLPSFPTRRSSDLGGCGRVGDCRNNFCGEGPVRGGRGPFLHSWVLFLFMGGGACPLLCQGHASAGGLCGNITPVDRVSLRGLSRGRLSVMAVRSIRLGAVAWKTALLVTACRSI